MALGVLESYRPTERFDSFAEIGPNHIRDLIDAGRTLFIIDIDGTVVENWGFDVDPKAEAMYSTIQEDPRAASVLATNGTADTEDKRTRLVWVVNETGAKYVVPKLAPDEKKPSPVNIHATLERENADRAELGLQPLTTANVVLIDDKLTAGIRAGNFATNRNDPESDDVYTIWVKRYGGPETDYKGDRFLRRPWEAAIWFALGRQSKLDRAGGGSGVYAPEAIGSVALLGGEPPSFGRVKLPKNIPDASGDKMPDFGVIANVGAGPKVEISAEKFDTLQPPNLQPVYDAIRKIQESAIMELVENRALHHGKEDANKLTLLRIAGIPLIIGALAMNKPKVARNIYIGLAVSDVIDGYLVRLQKKLLAKMKQEEMAGAEPVGSTELIQDIEGFSTRDHQVAEDPDLNFVKIGGMENSDEVEIDTLTLTKYHWDKEASLRQNIRQNYSILMERVNAPGWGERWDPKADKAQSNATGLALVLREWILGLPIGMAALRDVYREKVQRPKYIERGYTSEDLRPTTASKLSSFAVNIAHAVSLSKVSGKTSFLVQIAATADKWFSMIASKRIWDRRKKFRETAAEKRRTLSRMVNDKINDAVGDFYDGYY